jgi:hypothetical protein
MCGDCSRLGKALLLSWSTLDRLVAPGWCLGASEAMNSVVNSGLLGCGLLR